MSLQGFGYDDVVHQFENPYKLCQKTGCFEAKGKKVFQTFYC